MPLIDPVALAQALVRLDTAGPDTSEQAAIDLLAPLLVEAGFRVTTHAFSPGRPSLVAQWGRAGDGPPLAFSGHLDTVPVGTAPWHHDPHSGLIHEGRMHGRGTTDMKAGVAAIVAAAIRATTHPAPGARPILLVLTAGEEIGCLGAAHLRDVGALPRVAGIVVAEPTGNRIALGHRGALWLRAHYAGRSAHGSTPHLGTNAIHAAARGIVRCEALRFEDEADPLLGAISVNVGTMRGGLNVNSVPDHADFTLDLRSIVPGSHRRLTERVAATLGGEARLDVLLDLPAVRTAGDSALAVSVARAAKAVGIPDLTPITVPFFTDGSVLAGACSADTIIIGPGDIDLAHRTNESCSIQDITTATDLYGELMTA